MTVSSELSRKTFAMDGSTTSFSTSPVVFFDTSDLQVYAVLESTGAATLLTENTDYTVTGGDGSTGTVDTSAGYGAGSSSYTLVIVRSLPLTQEVDFVQNDASDAEVAEDALDKIVMICQQLQSQIDRAFRLADSDVTGADPTLPTPEANTLLGWDDDGLALVNYVAGDISPTILVSSFMETVLDDSSAANARATLDAAESVITTKGDLYVGGAAGAEARLAVGSNGLFLESNSGSTPGMRWGNPVKPFEARLTLTTAVPVTTSDVTAAETIYLTPYKGNNIALYDGTDWRIYKLTEISADVPDATQMNDVFVYDNAGTLTLDVVAWTNTTTRAVALATQDGVLVKTGATGRRYVGSFYSTTAGNGQTEDSLANRLVWNYYNRVARQGRGTFSADRSTASTSYVELNTEIRVQFVVGVSEDAVKVGAAGSVSNSTSDNNGTAIGFDGTTAEAGSEGTFLSSTANFNGPIGVGTVAKTGLAVGLHYATLLGKVNSNTGTWDSATAGQTAKCYVNLDIAA